MASINVRWKVLLKVKMYLSESSSSIGSICYFNRRHNKTGKKAGGTTSKRQKSKPRFNVKIFSQGHWEEVAFYMVDWATGYHHVKRTFREGKHISEKLNEVFVWCRWASRSLYVGAFFWRVFHRRILLKVKCKWKKLQNKQKWNYSK